RPCSRPTRSPTWCRSRRACPATSAAAEPTTTSSRRCRPPRRRTPERRKAAMPKVKAKLGFRGPRGVSKEIEVNIPEGEPPPWDLDTKLKVVGTSVPRIDGLVKVTGRAKYTYDQNPKGMLWGKMLHSPWGSASIKAMDVEALKKAPGVRAVHVIKDVGRPLQYHGDEILAIAADTQEQAEDALRDFKVEFERKPVATTIQAGLRPDSPMVFEG